MKFAMGRLLAPLEPTGQHGPRDPPRQRPHTSGFAPGLHFFYDELISVRWVRVGAWVRTYEPERAFSGPRNGLPRGAPAPCVARAAADRRFRAPARGGSVKDGLSDETPDQALPRARPATLRVAGFPHRRRRSCLRAGAPVHRQHADSALAR